MEETDEILRSAIGPSDSKQTAYLFSLKEEASRFLSQSISGGEALNERKVVIITSGGTYVPLEKKSVRFLENFSTGTRGATFAEIFLRAGFKVIFYARDTSFKPFLRHLQVIGRRKNSDNSPEFGWLEGLKISYGGDEILFPGFRDDDELRNRFRFIKEAVLEYSKFKESLLILTYKTISEYLYGISSLVRLCRPLGSSLIVMLAAAVSDFFLPYDELPENKIESSSKESLLEGAISLKLKPVPKMLKSLRMQCPLAFFIAFKLETDVRKLEVNAMRSLKSNELDMVIANELDTRYSVATCYAKNSAPYVAYANSVSSQVSVESSGLLEKKLFDFICETYMKSSSPRMRI